MAQKFIFCTEPYPPFIRLALLDVKCFVSSFELLIWLGVGIDKETDSEYKVSARSNNCRPRAIVLTLARAAGWWMQSPLSFFFENSEKTAARSASGFSASLWGILCAVFSKKKLTGSGQVTKLWRHKRYNIMPDLREIVNYCTLQVSKEQSKALLDYFRSREPEVSCSR